MLIEETLSALDLEMSVGALSDQLAKKHDIKKVVRIPGLHIRVYVSPHEAALAASDLTYLAVMNAWFFLVSITESIKQSVIEPAANQLQELKKLPVVIARKFVEDVMSFFNELSYRARFSAWVIQVKLFRKLYAIRERFYDQVAKVFWGGYDLLSPVYKFCFVLED